MYIGGINGSNSNNNLAIVHIFLTQVNNVDVTIVLDAV